MSCPSWWLYLVPCPAPNSLTNQEANLARNQTAYLALNQEAYLAPNQTAYLAPNQEAYLAPNQTADLVHNQVAYLVHYQEANLAPILRCNLLAALSSPSSLCRLAWIEAADEAVQAAKEKAENVHGRLDHSDNNGSPKTQIGQGVKQINEAKDKVKQVDDALQAVHTDLGNWKSAANSVLDSAVKNAGQVREKLNPDGSDVIGENIKSIEEAKNNIVTANSQLKTQVDSLHSWIDTAEDIRAKAERKAKEAYDKLEPHEALSKQIGEIVTANKKINEVHKSMQGVSKNLGEWKSEAGTVLDEAVKKATEVHDALDTDQKSDAVGHPVGYNIQQISTHNNLIKEANNTLATEVTALGSWHKAAQQIVSKAQHKSQEILDRVLKDNGDQTVIGENASKLKEKAENLLTAYSQAHGNVTGLVSKVTEAVKDLEAGMKDDLRRLQKDIVNSMKKHVGEMLGEIKTQVQVIKGKDSSDWSSSGKTLSGLDGIVHGLVNSYANEFKNNFANIAKGWLEATILEHNGTVRRILGWKHGHNMTGSIEQFGIGMKEKLNEDVTSVAKEAFQSVNTVSGGITKSIEAVQRLCNGFANALDKELYTAERKTVDYVKEKALNVGRLVANIKNCVCECDAQCTKCKNGECGKKAAAELIMCALTSTVRQVGNELHSVFLYGDRIGQNSGTSIAQELDKVVEETQKLHKNLGDAENETKKQPPGPPAGNQDNGILNKVKGVEQQVKSAMKETTSIDENFKQIMPLYEAAKGENGVGDHKYHNLLKTDIPNALKDFAPHVDNGKNEGIIKQKTEEIKKHLSTIDGELQEIAGMVQHEKKQLPQGQKPDGVKDYLGDLRGMVTQKDGEHSISSKLDDGNIKKEVQGLQAIQSKIHGLQTGTFKEKPGEIDSAVEQIKAQLGTIRTTLQNENGATDQDVIKRLQYMKVTGLGDSDTAKWKVGQNDVNGLGNIKSDLEKQNKQLGEQNKIIGDAVRKIQLQLRYLGFKLDHDFVPDDIMDQLQKLKSEIDKGGKGGLQKIHDVISGLQKGEFTSNPKAIGEANEAIKAELKAQMSALDSDVIETLTNLMTKGMSEQASWKQDKNVNGFQKIQNDLNTQQSELSTQPTAIGSGVQKITSELDELRKQLQGEQGADPNERGVIRNMEFVIEKIGKDKNEGLEKIKKEIEDLNRDTVPDINKFLGELCAKIASEAGSVDWKLGLFKENDIDKDLEKIKSQIDTLRTGDLHKAIAMCDKFLTNADYIKWEKVENIERFVDSEIEKAIAELSKQARRDYVESAKDALKHFAAKVAEELGELPEEINRDLFMGYKGLMKQMEGERSENINRLRNVQSRMLRALSSAFQNFFAPLDEYLRKEIERVKKQSDDEKNPSLPKSEEPYAAEWDAVHSDVNALLNYLCVTQGFDDRLRGLLHNLTDALTQLRPQGFQKPSTPTLDSVSRGLSAFVGEFGGAYVSRYSGAECREADADKYAKVLLSFTPMVHEALSNLAEKCGTNWRSYKICKLTPDGRDNGLGNYLTKCGFKVSPTDGLQEGELQNHGDMNGEQIHALLKSPVDVTTKMLIDGKRAENGINVVDLVALFYNMVCRYLQACHLKVHESPRYPCTVRDMLSWLSGLQYTPVADKLPDHCRALLNRKCDDNDAPNRGDDVMAQCINGLPFTIAEACSHADSLLIAIQGHGRGFDLAAYPYSVDFANNTAQLYYPDDPAEVLDMLRGIVCRLCSVLYFLYAQCCRATATTKGWRECRYGRQVPSSHWQCNTLGKEATDASHNCPPTSPLQSFLTDSCPSLLPHKLSVVDNAIECVDCPANLPGQQCLTPLGFWDLGLAASVERTGRELAKSLGRLCSDADACLFQLCRTLRLLCPSAPQSLGDVFALFFQMLRVWDHESSRRAYSHHESYLTHLNGEAIDGLFPLWPQLHGGYRNADLTDALKALAGHDHDNSGHNALSSLSAEPPCQSPSGCAPFLQPLALHANHTFPQKHAQLYVSWIVWLAWQLWELLESLLDALNNIDCTAHGCATCLCQPSNHNDKDSCHCPSLVECGGPLPTLYRYGFTYRNAHVLLAGSQKIRCSDLNDQLTKALHSDHFTQLFHQIDQLLYTIRMPFLFAITALWLIAALYILHSLLYRMDVLRIRSHLLTTRASHQVDVKALLAGSRRMLSLYKDWIEAADAAVNAAKEKAEDVHRRLDHNKKDQHGGTTIGQNIENIKQAKDKVKQVDGQLKRIHSDLGNWKNAASDVLDSAVKKATEVHGKLDPDKSKSTLGGKIGEIEDAKNNIISANSQLKTQVDSLRSWITTADGIRQKAQEKAEEAYKKLKPHEALTQKIGEIMNANKRIESVHTELGKVHSNLGAWKTQARSVLQGAIDKATEVWTALDDKNDDQHPVAQNINKISSHNSETQKANTQLAGHVKSLNDWNSAAQNVITKAEQKCEEILKRVDKDHKDYKGGKNGPVIYTQAEKLQNEGKRLLQAATDAKKAVESKVGDALNAVVEMDTSLKKDLKEVKDKIKLGMQNVIEQLEVNKLDQKVRDDLKSLKGNIMKLNQQVKDDDSDDNIVGGQLKALKTQKTILDNTTSKEHGSIARETGLLESKFQTAIQGPLNKKVKAVDTAIGKLGGKFTGIQSEEDKRTIAGIFEHIKGKVGKIKGESGQKKSKWYLEDGSGLLGIEGAINHYFEAFSTGHDFKWKIVKGWLDDMLPHNGVVKKILKGLGWDEKRGDFLPTAFNVNHSLTEKIRDTQNLSTEIQKGVDVFKGQQSTAGIQEKIKAVKTACETFADALDEKLKNSGNGIVSEVKGVEGLKKSGVQDPKCICDCYNCNYYGGEGCAKKAAAELIMCALTAVSRQVGKEVDSLMLADYRMGGKGSNMNIAKALDQAVAATNKLHGQLTAATATNQGTDPNVSPAQAVDKRLEAVRDEVNTNITNKFKSNVINQLEIEVKKLPDAVKEFDEKAKEQIRAAANTAIQQAAGQISKSQGKIEFSRDFMNKFDETHKTIIDPRDGLESQLKKQVENHIGQNDPTSGQGGKAAEKITITEDNFRNYNDHVKQDHSNLKNGNLQGIDKEGKLPLAIGDIKTQGLAALEKHIGDKPTEKIDDDTFTGPFDKIQKELEEITNLISDTRAGYLGESVTNGSGLKNLFKNLKSALDQGKLDGTDKGLDAIREAINGLQSNAFTTGPDEIEKAGREIKTQLEELRGKLKKDGDSDKTAVVNALQDLKEKGLGGHWTDNNNGDWKGTKGLTAIQHRLEIQNAELPRQTKQITKAIVNIKWELAKVGLKFQNIFTDNVIFDRLEKLKEKIGQGKKNGDHLQGIHDVISQLQKAQFTDHPNQIGSAKDQIASELNTLRTTLESKNGEDVITTLTDLQTKGLSDNRWDEKNVNGFQKIQNDLNTQQRTLTTQPEQINQGVNQITRELTELRTELQGKDDTEPKERGVIKNMEFMIKKIGEDKNEGLEKIKKDIATLNKDTVPDINKFLGELCAKIASEAGSVDWKLGLFKENNIDKDLEKIKSQIDTLRIDDLHKAIAMCDNFLTNAVYIKWEKVENIERFVDSEIEKAIAELSKQARRDYVESAKDALKHFAAKASEELGELPEEINRDLFVGFKGFMRQMEGERSENINRLRNVQSRMLRALSSAFQNFFAPLDEYLRKEIERVKKQSDDEKNPSLPKSEEPYAAEWDAVHSDVNALLNYLCVTQGFDDRLRGLLHNLTDALTQLRPQGFQKPSAPTLGSVSRGLSAFTAEFGDAYISTYSGAECRETDADKYAKVLLSLIPMTHEALTNLADKCGTNWKSNKICKLTGDDRDNGLGNYLTKCGFKVSPTDGLQEGELQNRFSGGAVHELLASPVAEVTTKMLIDGKPAENGINVVDLVALFYNMLCRYLQVCHLKVHESPRYPCTVRDMLSWLSGLQYTPVADKLPDHCRALLNRKCDDNDAPNRDDAVMAQCINGLPYTIAEACSHADLLLIAIQGHGRGFDLAAYPYSVDFANNTAQLHYPADPDELLEMMRRIICRLCRVLYFLYAQCCRATATTKGWRECHYGRQVPSSHWQCNTFDRQATDASHNCPPTSPLQSFLTDSCPSLLPHKLTVLTMPSNASTAPPTNQASSASPRSASGTLASLPQ
ncbi:Extracellular matrix-binding ebh [Babesia ovata]|uniref:Extracellular matrix-binding ebh n=1 Tax=Babesia ovata TaxID=189622 RepID=A0A2H6KJ25_9APIC|nr:Extracellular matrix-binding ebh [Babesia ovata]GBE62986.1 Extracellular matrix-binding ebh [Babesia ovata]